MAKIFPDIDNIKRLKPQPTEGEWYLINFLIDNFNDEYEVYFQPFLNGDEPDIILMRKGGGIMIFEVKDWNLIHYELDHKKNWILKQNKTVLKSPIGQVLKYKENLYNLHIDGLLDLHLKNYKYWFIVNCALYFHNTSTSQLRSFCKPQNSTENYLNFINKNISFIGRDSLNKNYIENLFDQKWISRRSIYFTDDLYHSFARFLQPSLHTIEQGIQINYTDRQKELSKSIAGDRKRIKGAAGSGKTLILAKRAVNAHIRTGKPVLILTYNITLRNYINDKINDVRDEFNWINFKITNFHDFIKNQLNNIGVDIEVPSNFNEFSDERKSEHFESNYFSNLQLFEKNRELFRKYETILIDEAQDYKENWIRIIDQNFLEENGEIVVFGDEKQNIYGRELDSIKMPKIPVQVGPWNSLKETFRLSDKIAIFASKFQLNFFHKKYEVEKIETTKQTDLFTEIENTKSNIKYQYLPPSTTDEVIIKYIFSLIKELNIHSNDVSVLSSRIAMLRNLDYEIRNLQHEKTQIMFETKEQYDTLKNQKSGNEFNREIEKIRKNRKLHFWMNRGTVKLSTIHSFKGWEIHTLFLVVENNLQANEELNKQNENFNPNIFSDELVYAGFTRCRFNLIIVNVGNDRYHEFFENEINKKNNTL